MVHVHDGENQDLIGKSYSECQDLANRLAGNYVGAARNKNKSEILKIIQFGIAYAFVDPPKQLSFLEAALMPFVSKLASSDIPDMYDVNSLSFLVPPLILCLIHRYLPSM